MHKPKVNLLKGEPPTYEYKPTDQYYDDIFHSAQKALDKDQFLKLPRCKKNLKYNFDGLYSYTTKIAHFDLPGRTIVKLGNWSPTSTAHHNYARRLVEDRYGRQYLMSN